jgi:GT2 family glycosyltransferase
MAELSVVICTHDRPDDLERCLAALARSEEPLEVVVVDSASRARCEALVEPFRERIPALTYIHLDQPGVSRARNAGVAASEAPVVAFLDDDTVAAPGWAAALLGAFARPDVGCVGGTCRPRFTTTRPRWLSDRLLQLAGITRFGDEPREARSSAEWPFGANMAFRREALVEAGPFSIALGRQGHVLLSGEDSDMVARVRGCGRRIWLEPGAIVEHTVHPERCRPGYYWRRLWWNGVSRAVKPSARVTIRLLVSVPLRLLMWAAVRDRLYLYRVAETAGYLAARLGFASLKVGG